MLSNAKRPKRVREDRATGRFRLVKLEERIAPQKNGWNNPKNPHYSGYCK